MNDKELLQKIKNVRTAVKEIYGNVNTITYPIYMVDWLIEQAEKAEWLRQNLLQSQKEIEWLLQRIDRCKEQLKEAQEQVEYFEMKYENTGAVFNRQYMQEKIERYEKAIKETLEIIKRGGTGTHSQIQQLLEKALEGKENE
jgi:cell division septum initiation protein DivIVA